MDFVAVRCHPKGKREPTENHQPQPAKRGEGEAGIMARLGSITQSITLGAKNMVKVAQVVLVSTILAMMQKYK